MNAVEEADAMLSLVASALGADLLDSVAFVGGCTTSFHLTDKLVSQHVRFTDDVDLIVDVLRRVGWNRFQSLLRKRGFTESTLDDVTCRMRLGELKVDFMPDDELILGFSNPWYRTSLDTAENRALQNGQVIKVIKPNYFLATKISAYKGRGQNDPLSSHDIEDVLTVVDGRIELVDELTNSPIDLQAFISREIRLLLSNPDFEYAVQSTVHGDINRQKILQNRLEQIAENGDPS